jgi:alkanesulfonate monooxygenase SsuD/methylene tetrahydromethanopterin reductase-like flavin-dependent oxidoreductase (luciferase family)
MIHFGLRYDLRRPDFARATSSELFTAAIEQCAWADERGFVSVTLSEHHGSPDGYLPSPMVLGGAIAARTKRMLIVFGALISPLHDPIRLAEDLAVIDLISGGRVLPIVSGGYVESEFRTFGRELRDRRRLMDAIVPLLEKAWSGEPFDYMGTTARVTPRPHQQPRPPIFMGGASRAAARRAARFADGFMPTLPEVWEFYREACTELGKPDPGEQAKGTGNYVFVAEDPEAAWAKIAPHAMHEMNAYGAWASASGSNTGYQPVSDADTLRASGQYPIYTPDELIAKAKALGESGTVMLHPLMGGTDPDLAWECLELIETKVMPALR